ncbi:Na+/H+ antiporter NhaC family protein [Botrimarina mediterranea]|uniref:Malate-2H(+)/Na(+)-lactate antiporter n=1 Tax=Botrimarina mediterranea TaxID=2528022 RepID=A0A518K656_9BACT|nr:Na+/H+ antiporter NhaC family protein [Botrimarina mediterranea]QDV73271.1 Malate-2H(+)/Na(+)-lactate antiporter [Botrimarina mediterranea]QDV77788.1 Malate-2H(+)/Na(+)-lactate antiporter [Planctomycetes bacterium K2D]
MHPYGILSLAPPVIAVVMAIATRRILPSVLVGLFAGALLTTGGDVVQAVIDMGEVHLWPTFVEPGKLRLFTFTMAMGAAIGLINASGGMLGLVGLLTPLAKGPKSAQVTGWFMGLLVFFDDYANTLLLGGALRPVFDRLKISREKLAYVVDSTAAPVAGLAVVSTWVAVELSYIEEGLANLTTGVPEDVSAFSLFVACLPYRFYVIQALVFVPLIAILGRDFGPMLAAERAAKDRAEEDLVEDSDLAGAPQPSHWSNAVLPLGLTLLVVLCLLWATGVANLGEKYDPAAPALEKFRNVFGAADSGLALMYGGLAGLAAAILMVRWKQLLPPPEISQALVRGVLTVLPAVAILWLAGAMSRMTGNRDVDGAPTTTPYEFAATRLYTGEYLTQQLLGTEGAAPTATLKALLPTGVFLISAVVAFCTGTSFGTMGLVVPMVVPIAFAAAGDGAPGDPTTTALFLASLGSVLAGAIFGDHCSPISDTTILSSIASRCDHIAHVRTQLPYAMTVAAVVVLLGTLPLALGVNVWVLLALQSAALVGIVWLLGEKA